MSEYHLAATREAARLDARAEVLSAQVRRDIQRASNYVLGVVLCAVALFFAGISTRLGHQGVRAGLVALGWLVFLGAVAWIATSPVSVGI
jgi:hypothetical protein